MKNFVVNTLAPPSGVNPFVYILLAVSFFIGLAFSPLLPLEATESILYGVTFIFSKGIWGTLLLGSTILSFTGIFLKKENIFFVGGMTGFMLWLFACIALIMAGQWYVFVTVGLLHLLFHGYLYLGASTGLIFRG